MSDYVDVMLYRNLWWLDVTSVRTLGSTVASSNTFQRKGRPFRRFDISKQELAILKYENMNQLGISKQGQTVLRCEDVDKS